MSGAQAGRGVAPSRRRDRLAVLAAAAALGAALALVTWRVGYLDAFTFGDLQQSVASSPGSAVSMAAVGAAFVIGAAMIVLPCGYPSVFVVPAILLSRPRLHQRALLALLFLLGSALLLAMAGVVLSFAGAGVLDLLESERAKLAAAAVVASGLGLLAIGYALSELGLIRLPSLQAGLTGPALPDERRPYARSLVLGATFGGGLGIACPMPTYYVILGWVVVAAQPLYGAVLMAAYGLGRVVPAVVLGTLMAAGLSRRVVSQRLVRAQQSISLLTAVVLAALGGYLIVLFGGVLGARAL